MIDINLYKAILGHARFDIDIQDVEAYLHNIYDRLNLILEYNELSLNNNDKIYLLDFGVPSTSYVYYDRYTNCTYAKSKRIPKRLR